MNTYIIDTFLAFWLWFGLSLLYWDVSSLVKKANEALTADVFAVYFDMLVKPVLLISVLPMNFMLCFLHSEHNNLGGFWHP